MKPRQFLIGAFLVSPAWDRLSTAPEPGRIRRRRSGLPAAATRSIKWEGGAPIVEPGDLDEPTSAEHNREIHQRFLAAIMPRLEALASLVREARAAREHYGWLPDANSQAMREVGEEGKFGGSWGSEPVRSCYSAAGVLLAAAEDHARSITELLFLERAPLFGHVVLARSALESTSRVLWLSQLGIGVRSRVARSYTDALDNLYQLSRLSGQSSTLGCGAEGPYPRRGQEAEVPSY